MLLRVDIRRGGTGTYLLPCFIRNHDLGIFFLFFLNERERERVGAEGGFLCVREKGGLKRRKVERERLSLFVYILLLLLLLLFFFSFFRSFSQHMSGKHAKISFSFFRFSFLFLYRKEKKKNKIK